MRGPGSSSQAAGVGWSRFPAHPSLSQPASSSVCPNGRQIQLQKCPIPPNNYTVVVLLNWSVSLIKADRLIAPRGQDYRQPA